MIKQLDLRIISPLWMWRQFFCKTSSNELQFIFSMFLTNLLLLLKLIKFFGAYPRYLCWSRGIGGDLSVAVVELYLQDARPCIVADGAQLTGVDLFHFHIALIIKLISHLYDVASLYACIDIGFEIATDERFVEFETV